MVAASPLLLLSPPFDHPLVTTINAKGENSTAMQSTHMDAAMKNGREQPNRDFFCRSEVSPKEANDDLLDVDAVLISLNIRTPSSSSSVARSPSSSEGG